MEITLETSEVFILVGSFANKEEGRKACDTLAEKHIAASLYEHDSKPWPYDVYVAMEYAVEALGAMQ
jgi:hypothetical protein